VDSFYLPKKKKIRYKAVGIAVPVMQAAVSHVEFTDSADGVMTPRQPTDQSTQVCE
jgi:hypothetical protein